MSTRAAKGEKVSDRGQKNTDREIWRGRSRAEFGDDDRFYADSLFIPDSPVEALGINCGGMVIVKPIRELHRLALASSPTREQIANLVERLPHRFLGGRWKHFPARQEGHDPYCATCQLAALAASLPAPAPDAGLQEALISQCKTIEQMFDDGFSSEEIERYLDFRIFQLIAHREQEGK